MEDSLRLCEKFERKTLFPQRRKGLAEALGNSANVPEHKAFTNGTTDLL